MAIYFIQAENGGPIKIGYTNRPIEKRLSGIQTGHPYKLKVLFVYYGFTITEYALHKIYKKHRIHGEWFEDVKEIYDEIKALKIKQEFEQLFHYPDANRLKYLKKIAVLQKEAWAPC